MVRPMMTHSQTQVLTIIPKLLETWRRCLNNISILYQPSDVNGCLAAGAPLIVWSAGVGRAGTGLR